MSFEIIPSIINGCYEISFNKLNDNRGHFTKTFNIDMFNDLGISMQLKEEYFTFSTKNVFRGLHFQLPPKAIDKIVYCINGKVNDYVVDLRKTSPTYGKYVCFELDSEKPTAIFVPAGLAHGFHVLSDSALMQYKVSGVFDKDYDTGISYKTFDFAKEIISPNLSERDKGFVTFDEFETPF